MPRKAHKPESPLPALARDLTVSKVRLAAVLAAGRARIYADIQRRAARNPAFAANGSARERVLAGIGSHYDKMAVELDQWSEELAARVGGNFFNRAKADTHTANAATRYNREYAERYLRMVHEENAPSLAAVRSQQMRANDMQALRSTVINVLNEAAVTGMTAKQVRREMLLRMDSMVVDGLPSWQFLDDTGRKWESGNYFDMLTRTLTSNVARAAYTDAMAADGFDLASIEGGGDPCPACTAWRGVIVSLSGANKDYPSLDDAKADGVFHPNCVCEPRYVDEEVDKEQIAAQAELEPPESPEDGAPDWREYAKQVRENKSEREYDPVAEVPEPLESTTSVEDIVLTKNAARARVAPDVLSMNDLEEAIRRPYKNETVEKQQDRIAMELAKEWNPSKEALQPLLKEAGFTEKGTAENYVASILRSWSGSSGGPVISVMARAVMKEMGIKAPPDIREAEELAWWKTRPKSQSIVESLGKLIYKQTQAKLEELGLASLHLWRKGDIEGRPFTSWSTSWGGVRHTGGGSYHEMYIPARRIWSVPATGMGSRIEAEAVVIGPIKEK